VLQEYKGAMIYE